MGDFKTRLVDEFNELQKKRFKLSDFINTETFDSLSQTQRGLLRAQEGAMFAYEQILKLRLDDLGVDYANQIH